MCMRMYGAVVFPVTDAYFTASKQYAHFRRDSAGSCTMDSSKSAQREALQFPLTKREHASQIYRRIKAVY